jgi:hypothetical protein
MKPKDKKPLGPFKLGDWHLARWEELRRKLAFTKEPLKHRQLLEYLIEKIEVNNND